jgi:hypothetical protein
LNDRSHWKLETFGDQGASVTLTDPGDYTIEAVDLQVSPASGDDCWVPLCYEDVVALTAQLTAQLTIWDIQRGRG